MFTIELTRGLSWSEPIETIDRRKCDTISIEFVAAEALHWLLTTQKNVPTWGVTHYRVVNHGEAVIGGDTLTAANVRGDSRFIVTNLAGLPKSLYEKVYCARGQAENPGLRRGRL